MSRVLDYFLKYVGIDTESKEDEEAVPSTKKQFHMAEMLVEQLNSIGAREVTLSEHCYVYATIPATSNKKLPVLGFIAHMDTSCAISGADVKPRIVNNYQGGDIYLNKKLNITMKQEDFPKLADNIGTDLIVTDGTTLLGADDKAGVAEIMAMAEYLCEHTEIEHGMIKLGFTPDEEVGRGVDFFDVEGFGADFAYTVDGGELGEIECENFNAASARLKIKGSSIHPGTAKGKMKNALLIGMEFNNLLPVFDRPEYTEGYEGFYHLTNMSGGVEEANMCYIIRDHDKVKFEQRKAEFLRAVRFITDRYGEDSIAVTVKDSYYNMKEMILPHYHLVENAAKAMKKLNIVPNIVPIRGGTDGARLSYMGLPCPNLCTGGYNFHGKYEYIPIQSMEQITELLLELVNIYSREDY